MIGLNFMDRNPKTYKKKQYSKSALESKVRVLRAFPTGGSITRWFKSKRSQILGRHTNL